MRISNLALTLVAAAAFAQPAAAHVLDGTLITDQSMAPLAAWVEKQMDVTIDVLPVAIASDMKLKNTLHLSENVQRAGAVGAYVPGRLLLSSEIWDPKSVEAQSYLLHELVHHAQMISGHVYPCHAAKEREAYTMQSRWLVEQGRKPLVSQAWIEKMSACNGPDPDGDHD